MENIQIKRENIVDPPEKMRLMFEAVSELIREKKDVFFLKVQDITSRAGIGKGTAYEYFSSKEELIANAMLYEYTIKVHELVEQVKAANGFKARVFRIFDWIRENREYNLMLRRIFMGNFDVYDFFDDISDSGTCPFLEEGKGYIFRIMLEVLEQGYLEKEFIETDTKKRFLAFWTALMEYAYVVMAPKDFGDKMMPEKQLREFVYESMTKALN